MRLILEIPNDDKLGPIYVLIKSGQTSERFPANVKLCSRCYRRPRSESSKSYCKECHAARVKKWRLSRET